MSARELHCPECGAVFSEEKKGKTRSVEQHRRYFGVLRATFLHWPESHPVQFSSEEECRKFLQMKAGHKTVSARIPIVGVSRERAVMLAEASIRAAGSYAVPIAHGGDLVVFVPKSIAFDKLSHLEFCRLSNQVEEVIKAETGLDPDSLLNETEKAA